MMSMGVLQTGHCLSRIRCLSMLQCRPCSESASEPTTWKVCMHGKRRTRSPTQNVSKQMGHASRHRPTSSSRTATARVFAVIISCVANGTSRGSTMCMTHATMEVYHMRSVCASSRSPHECGISAGQSTSYSRVKTLPRAVPPEPHLSRVYRFVAFHSLATKYRCSSPRERRLSSKMVCSLRCCEPSSCVPCARYALHVKCDIRNWKHTTGTSSPALIWKGPPTLSGLTRSEACNAARSVWRPMGLSRRLPPLAAVASPVAGLEAPSVRS
mmetsp:Transcript_44843/g.116122  ORF Transcript_44843/g.116122 Transcript_44843/m.116122 type:complete len:270 (-) Transcript_44843:290-1099(-)